MGRIRELRMLFGNVHVDETYVNVAEFGELPLKRGVSKNRESERDFERLVERGSYVTHDDSNYGHAFGGCLEATLNSKDRKSHFLMNPVNSFCCQVQRIFTVHLRIHRNNVQKYLDTLCADYMSEKDKFPEFLRENRERIFSSGIMLRRSDVYDCSATL